MPEIISILEALSPSLSTKTLKHLHLLIEATLSMTGRVTMLGISRWTEKGGSYRTVQRFFKGTHKWAELRWLLIKSQLNEACLGTWILIGDEVVVTKSGKKTHGLSRFFSSIQNQVVPSLCFINLSLLHVESSQSYPLLAEQLLKKEAQETAPKQKQKKGSVGRPLGSKNKNKADVILSAFQQQLQGCIRQALKLIGSSLAVKYFVYDGALGTNAGLQTVKQTGLHLVSKLRHDSVLYFPFVGESKGRGRPKKYGDKLTLDTLTEDYLCETSVKKNIETHIYQVQVWHKKFSSLLNVVVLVKKNMTTGKVAKVLLFSDDLELTYDKVIHYYRLRFQIEFNFRDAKQHWGLEDFMNIKEAQVTNAANFSLFMVTFSQILLPKMEEVKHNSMLDLKATFRARKYTYRIINALNLNVKKFLIDRSVFQSAEIGKIHTEIA
ncbi:MAG: transposase [Methyloprofundus sp.]|nr:transposase [Methyloprofundus sp.]